VVVPIDAFQLLVQLPQTGSIMSVKVEARGSDVAVAQQRRAWANKVLEEYFAGKLPELRLLVFMDEIDVPTLKRGKANRGLFSPIDKHYFQTIAWPKVLGEMLRTVNLTSIESTYNCDALIYLHDSACHAEDSLTMTLAHELQHFVQYGFDRSTWVWNILPSKLSCQTIDTLGFAWHDIPIEHEARIVAKRACESLLGPERTTQYIKNRKSQHITDKDAADWGFILGIDTTSTYECATQTRLLFKRLAPVRPDLQEALNKVKSLPDFAQLNLDDIMEL
jgi:hypothetical protein